MVQTRIKENEAKILQLTKENKNKKERTIQRLIPTNKRVIYKRTTIENIDPIRR